MNKQHISKQEVFLDTTNVAVATQQPPLILLQAYLTSLSAHPATSSKKELAKSLKYLVNICVNLICFRESIVWLTLRVPENTALEKFLHQKSCQALGQESCEVTVAAGT